MKTWPVPNSNTRLIPKNGVSGSFWENRKDRRHAGVDIYAPKGSEVLAIEAGKVLEVCEFTSPTLIPYWFVTYSILIQTGDGKIQRYAEIGEALVAEGQIVQSGEVIGYIGYVLNHDKIGPQSPGYIQSLKAASVSAMLHFEMYSTHPVKSKNYLGGNFFNGEKPENLLNPTDYLTELEDSNPTDLS